MFHYHIKCSQSISPQKLYCKFPQQHFLMTYTLNATTPNSTNYGIIHYPPHSVLMAQLAYHLRNVSMESHFDVDYRPTPVGFKAN